MNCPYCGLEMRGELGCWNICCKSNIKDNMLTQNQKTPLEAFQEFYDVVKSSDKVSKLDSRGFSVSENDDVKIFSWRNTTGSMYRVFEMGFSKINGNLSFVDIELPYG